MTAFWCNPFEIRVQRAGEVVYVEPAGELDLATTFELQQRVEGLRGDFAHLVIDLRQLTFLDATGLRLLLSLNTAATSDGWRLSLISGPSAIRRIFTLTGTLELLPLISPLALVELTMTRIPPQGAPGDADLGVTLAPGRA